ncbi:hypothetical protein [Microtetraspora glauca]|uniref:Uncharacterized protein n=1 Tax=Microtetraspora glauca TaxID=1996 RepID=A0ABV3GJD6_MICGL
MDVELRTEADHVQGFGVVVLVEVVERFIPGGQKRAGCRVKAAAQRAAAVRPRARPPSGHAA